MLIIDHLVQQVSQEDLLHRERDEVVLTWEQRRWTRGRLITRKGREIALALPTGTTLEPGAVLRVEPEWYIAVEAAAEPVLAIFPSGYENAVKIAFEVGNRHFALALEDHLFLVPDDPAMLQLITRLGARWERRKAVFNPVGHGHEH